MGWFGALPAQVNWITWPPSIRLEPRMSRHLSAGAVRNWTYGEPPSRSGRKVSHTAVSTQSHWSTTTLLFTLPPGTSKHFPVCTGWIR